MRNALAMRDLLALPAVVDVVTAGRALGIGRTTAYELARRGEFPCRVLRVGASYRVPTAELLKVLGVDPRPGVERHHQDASAGESPVQPDGTAA